MAVPACIASSTPRFRQHRSNPKATTMSSTTRRTWADLTVDQSGNRTPGLISSEVSGGVSSDVRAVLAIPMTRLPSAARSQAESDAAPQGQPSGHHFVVRVRERRTRVNATRRPLGRPGTVA
jgi:hypothetical protein